MSIVYLGIGGNLGDRLINIDNAILLISKKIGTPIKISSVYLSEPWGFYHAKYFTNLVMKLETILSPEELLIEIQDIEKMMKRLRSVNGYEGRTMDIDVLFFDNMELKTKSLEIPHPKIQDRLFVLKPMAEISPEFVHCRLNKNIKTLLTECKDIGKIRKLNYGA